MILSDYAFEKRLKLVLEYLSPYDTILDFGAGGQRMTKILRQKNYSVKSLDVSPDYHCDFTAPGENTCLPAESFDKVIAIEVLEHGFFVSEIERILKPGGLLIFTIPNPKTELALSALMKLGLVKDRVTPHINLRFPPEHQTEKLTLIHYRPLFFGMDFFGVLQKKSD